MKRIDKDKKSHYVKVIKDYNYEKMERNGIDYRAKVRFNRKPFAGLFGKIGDKNDKGEDVQRENS